MRLRADRRVGLLLGGVVFAVLVAVGATVALPASDPDVRSTEGARSLDPLAARGLEIYRSQGCWYCHTQTVRTTPVDAVYGEALPASAYAEMSPATIGGERIGPDLTHVGTRYADADALIEVLRGAEGRSSSMPSYTYLSVRDLEALTAYLLSLR